MLACSRGQQSSPRPAARWRWCLQQNKQTNNNNNTCCCCFCARVLVHSQSFKRSREEKHRTMLCKQQPRCFCKLCTRGLRHGGKGGRCSLRAEAPPFQRPMTVTPPASGQHEEHPLLSECSICLSSLNDGELQWLPCAHVFHAACIQPWLIRSPECPECKKPVYVDV